MLTVHINKINHSILIESSAEFLQRIQEFKNFFSLTYEWRTGQSIDGKTFFFEKYLGPLLQNEFLLTSYITYFLRNSIPFVIHEKEEEQYALPYHSSPTVTANQSNEAFNKEVISTCNTSTRQITNLFQASSTSQHEMKAATSLNALTNTTNANQSASHGKEEIIYYPVSALTTSHLAHRSFTFEEPANHVEEYSPSNPTISTIYPPTPINEELASPIPFCSPETAESKMNLPFLHNSENGNNLSSLQTIQQPKISLLPFPEIGRLATSENPITSPANSTSSSPSKPVDSNSSTPTAVPSPQEISSNDDNNEKLKIWRKQRKNNREKERRVTINQIFDSFYQMLVNDIEDPQSHVPDHVRTNQKMINFRNKTGILWASFEYLNHLKNLAASNLEENNSKKKKLEPKTGGRP